MKTLPTGLLVLTVLLVPAVHADVPDVDGAEEIEIIEELSEVEEIVPQTTEPPGAWEVMGRLHPAAVHIPIGWILMLLIVELGIMVLRKREWEKWSTIVLVLTLISLVPAVSSGLIRASDYPPDESGLLALHRNLMFVVSGLLLAAAAVRITGNRKFQGALRWAHFFLVMASAAFVTIGGHLGGKLVFGENHLPF